MTIQQKIVFGIPKGSLQDNSLLFLKKAGFDICLTPRVCQPKADNCNMSCFLLRAEEIPKYVALGKLDAGITGSDWVLENKAKVVKVADLDFAKATVGREADNVRWVLAAPQTSKIRSVKDLQGKVIVSELAQVTRAYLEKNNVKAKVEFSWGATEAKPFLGADAIVDITETGESLRANNLKIIDTVLKTKTQLIASPNAWSDPWKQETIKNIGLLLQSRISGHRMTNTIIHTDKENLQNVLRLVKKISKPWVKHIAGSNFVEVSFRCDGKIARDFILRLKRAGAQDIIQHAAFPLV